MYLPGNAAAYNPLYEAKMSQAEIWTINGSGKGSPPGGWSSLIGIVTAIVGNILISFALNTQRYAHMRLSEDREDWKEKQKAQRRRRDTKQQTYGTQQLDVAEVRAKDHAKDGKGDYSLQEPVESNEGDPLIPHVDLRRTSESSDETVRPNEKEDESPKEKSYLKSPIWWVGISLMVVGEAGNFLAYGFAPASIVSPLGVVALVSNCLIAPLLLGEKFRWRDGLGVVIAIAGCVTVVLSASDSNPRLSPDKIWHLISQWEFETYLGVTVFLIIVLVIASNKFGEKTILIDLGLVGLFGGYTVLSTKGISSLLSTSIWRVVTFPIFYLLLAVLIFTAVMQIKYVNRALQHFNATMVIPVQFVLFTLSVIIGSAILYRDFERESTEDAAKFFAGCALTFLGVWCITSGRSDDVDGDVELGEEEDAIDLVDEERMQPEIREREDGDRRRSIIAGSSKVPRLRRLSTEPTPPSFVLTPVQEPQGGQLPPPLELEHEESLLDVSPADRSAIHSKSMTELPQEGEAKADPRKPPPLHATTSAPVLPHADLASSLRPRTPLSRNKTGPATDSPTRRSPTTPAQRRLSQAQHLDANGSSHLLARHSVAGLLPGPLTSPLSGSLSAIVADSLRRGVDSPSSTFRRRRSRSRRPPGMESTSRRATQSAALKRHSIASGTMDLEDEESANLHEAAASPKGRLRSMSATLGDIFRSTPKRQRLESQESVQQVQEETGR